LPFLGSLWTVAVPTFSRSKKISPENSCAIAGPHAAGSEFFTIQAWLILGGCCQCPELQLKEIGLRCPAVTVVQPTQPRYGLSMQRTWRKSDVVGCIYLLNRRLPVIGPVRSGCVVKGLVLSETAHGSSHDLDAHVGYQGKRTARLHNNEQVTQRNKQRGEQRRHAAHKALTAGVCGAKLSVALQSQNNDHTQALAPVKHLIDDMTGLLRHVQAVANALERPLSSGALAKRVARILDAAPPPQNQSELQTALLAMEVVFAAKRRPHLVAAVLDAVPVKQRQHFENID
jgi:hypothetical protein